MSASMCIYFTSLVSVSKKYVNGLTPLTFPSVRITVVFFILLIIQDWYRHSQQSGSFILFWVRTCCHVRRKLWHKIAKLPFFSFAFIASKFRSCISYKLHNFIGYFWISTCIEVYDRGSTKMQSNAQQFLSLIHI